MKIPVTVYETVPASLSLDELDELCRWRGCEFTNIGGQLYRIVQL